MKINFKNKMYIYHPDSKFTEAQLLELLEAARKMGYDEGHKDGYDAGKLHISWGKPWWWQEYPYYTVTCGDNGSILNSSTSTSESCDSIKAFNFEPTTYTFKCDDNGGFEKLLNEESDEPITLTFKREFKYDGTER